MTLFASGLLSDSSDRDGDSTVTVIVIIAEKEPKVVLVANKFASNAPSS